MALSCTTRTTHDVHRRPMRPAFTLTELLIVISILAILATLGATVVLRFVGVQEKNNTETLIRKLHPILMRNWSAVVEQANKEPIPQAIRDLAPGNERRARALYIKYKLKQEFPQNWVEATNPTPLIPIPSYLKVAQTGSPGGAEFESAACLLMALQRSRSKGVVIDESDIGSSYIRSTNGVPYLVDGWGNPLVFIRWPYLYPDLNPGGPNPNRGVMQNGLNDPDDPEGMLLGVTLGFLTPAGRLAEMGPTGGPISYKLFPLIISSGPNNRSGLMILTGEIDSPPDAADNVDSYNLTRFSQ